MERAREHAHAAGTTGSTPQKSTDEEEDENVFAASGEGDEEGDDISGGGAAAGSGSMVVVEGIRSLIRATWEDVKDWCDEEAEARVRRKDAQVRVCHNCLFQGSLFPPFSGMLASHPCLRLFTTSA